MFDGNTENTRLVYSSDVGRVESSDTTAPAPAGDGVVRISRTKSGRKGKTVTLVTGVPAADVAGVGKELKRRCGSGGSVKDGVIELQGDHRTTVVDHLSGRYRVKLAGG